MMGQSRQRSVEIVWELDGGHVIGTQFLGAVGADWHLLV
jgi:hypothetical protein